MKSFYAKIGDIEISYGDFFEKAGEQRLPIWLERTEGEEIEAFAETLAPSCKFVRSEGFNEFELETLGSLLQRNLPLLWDDALEAAAG